MGVELVERQDFGLFIETGCIGLGRHYLENKQYEPHVESCVGGCMRMTGGVFVDVGAHVGLFSMIAIANGASKVVAYEPNYESYRLLNANMALNWSDHPIRNDICTSNKAVGVFNGRCGIKSGDEGNTGDFRVCEGSSVPLVRLGTDLPTMGIKHVDMVKIDVQGCEIDVFKGLVGISWGHVVMEVNGDLEETKKEISEFMRGFGVGVRFDDAPDTLVIHSAKLEASDAE